MSRLQSILLGVISAVALTVAPAEAQPQTNGSAQTDPYYAEYGGDYGYSYGGYTSAYNPYYDPSYDPYYDPYCDYYTPPWGYPPDYCRYSVWYDPVYVGGIWYSGPIYYGLFWGAPWFWLNGYWWRDEWHGNRPAYHDWNRADHKRWDGAQHDWRQDYERGTWAGQNSWAGRNFGNNAAVARRAISARERNPVAGRDRNVGGRDVAGSTRNLDGRNSASANRDFAERRVDGRRLRSEQRGAVGDRNARNDLTPRTRAAQNGPRFGAGPFAERSAFGYGGYTTPPTNRRDARGVGGGPRYGAGVRAFGGSVGSAPFVGGGGPRFTGSMGGARSFGGGGGSRFSGGMGGGARSFAGGGGGRSFGGGGGGGRGFGGGGGGGRGGGGGGRGR